MKMVRDKETNIGWNGNESNRLDRINEIDWYLAKEKVKDKKGKKDQHKEWLLEKLMETNEIVDNGIKERNNSRQTSTRIRTMNEWRRDAELVKEEIKTDTDLEISKK